MMVGRSWEAFSPLTPSLRGPEVTQMCVVRGVDLQAACSSSSCVASQLRECCVVLLSGRVFVFENLAREPLMWERALCSPSVEFNARVALNIFVFSVCSDSLMFRTCLKKKKVGWCHTVFSSQIHGGRDLPDPRVGLASGDRIKDPSCVNICRWLSDSNCAQCLSSSEHSTQCSLEIAAPVAGGMAAPTDNSVSSFLLPSVDR